MLISQGFLPLEGVKQRRGGENEIILELHASKFRKR